MSISITNPNGGGGAGCNLFDYDEINFPDRVQNGQGSIIPYTAEKDGWVSILYSLPLVSNTTYQTMQFGILKDDGREWTYLQVQIEWNEHNHALLASLPIHQNNSASHIQSFGPYYFKKGQKVIFALTNIATGTASTSYPWNAWLRKYK